MKRFLTLSFFSALLLLIFFLLPYGTWAAIGNLPAHPLIVHVVVIMLPLTSLILLVALFKGDLMDKWHMHLIVLLTICTLASLMAKSSGNSLAAAVGLPQDHAEWGNILVPVAAALVGATILYSFFSYYFHFFSNSFANSFAKSFFNSFFKNDLLQRVLRLAVGLLSIATIGLTLVVGHSGAESVWKDRYAAAKVPLALGLDSYTAEEVAQHNSATDCWTIVDGFVYDMTTFASRHPGGSSAIKRLCGVDGSREFLGEHGGQNEPENWLETLKIGKLK